MSESMSRKSNTTSMQPMTRRQLLRFGLVLVAVPSVVLTACERKFVRPGGLHDLGAVKDLLSGKQHIADRSILVYRDDNGWAALSTRCTREGCDLTYQPETLYCHCCDSLFSHTGAVLRGPATMPLPWYKVFYEDRHLYADSGEMVDANFRFTNPAIEQAIQELLKAEKTEETTVRPNEIPKVLQGIKDRRTLDTMFIINDEKEREERRKAMVGRKSIKRKKKVLGQ